MLATAGRGLFGQDAPREDTPRLRPVPLPVDPHRVMDYIFDGRPDSALIVVDRAIEKYPNEPFLYILKTRAMREMLPDEDDNKSLIKAGTRPMHDLLDIAVELSDEALKNKQADSRYLYYRGVARLYKAQLNTLTRSYWQAGRNGSKGKGDLSDYLEIVPDDPDANGSMGALLYFADALPGIVKFLGRILFLPTGDRDRGFEMLRYASQGDGVFARDYQIALAAIDFVFEGRFEEGSAAMRRLIDEHPYYTRLVEPFGVIAPLSPLRVREYHALEDEAIARHVSRGEALIDWSLVKRIKYHRTYTDMYCTSPLRALEEFDRLIAAPPQRPDWVLPLCLLNRGFLYAKIGRDADALRDFDFVKSSKNMRHFYDVSRKLERSIDDGWARVDLADLSFVGLIYDGLLDEAERGLERYASKYGRDVVYYFYLGEIELFEQDFDEAAVAFDAVLELDTVGGDETYQMFAALRLAEIHGHELHYDEAQDYIDRATDYIHMEYLLDMQIRARKRFYSLLEDGKITTPPSLLFHRTPERAIPSNPAQGLSQE